MRRDAARSKCGSKQSAFDVLVIEDRQDRAQPLGLSSTPRNGAEHEGCRRQGNTVLNELSAIRHTGFPLAIRRRSRDDFILEYTRKRVKSTANRNEGMQTM